MDLVGRPLLAVALGGDFPHDFRKHELRVHGQESEAGDISGITRDTVIRLAPEAGIEVREQAVTREMLYLCDELFMTGTAAEVTPVRSVDRKTITGGKPGPISLQLQSAYFDLVKERVPDTRGWLDAV